ncbi:tRNA threonylcarbamoyladenosine biosynthesis protein TsaE [Roseimaritima multifibrata]|uniref:tRNA threonylcarbamoyladenosine biosynthesis protein TsaE n=1 Tax=Roseimaritima multifibrata TaxID=1930274 RepID=A0A517MKR8_9BACT|nr:tRNA (adenosine(37)-N6)-threonylcarbamoyltransferase complex ATPase subunit type 1 TsaE [Roseimaritima multifibrata]QDS95486.1 tRNA threonylcarbamoyladenosine biosynthesis protein TsaE [Roseimaritima multifibrata]
MSEEPVMFHSQHSLLATLQWRTPEETLAFAQLLDLHLPERCGLGLVGTLGAGKTFLAQRFAETIGVEKGTVTSPTFTVVQEYQAKRRLTHLDAYRIVDEDELWELGIDELFEEPAVTLIEWADRFAAEMPQEMLWIQILLQEDGSRTVRISGDPGIWSERVGKIQAALS